MPENSRCFTRVWCRCGDVAKRRQLRYNRDRVRPARRARVRAESSSTGRFFAMSKAVIFFAPGLEECEGLLVVDILRRAGE